MRFLNQKGNESLRHLVDTVQRGIQLVAKVCVEHTQELILVFERADLSHRGDVCEIYNAAVLLVEVQAVACHHKKFVGLIS